MLSISFWPQYFFSAPALARQTEEEYLSLKASTVEDKDGTAVLTGAGTGNRP